jgi:hypothetical protein
VDSLGTFIQGGAAVFFGSLGLKQVVLPPASGVRTLVDYAIGALYIVFAIVILPHLWRSLKGLFGRSVAADIEVTDEAVEEREQVKQPNGSVHGPKPAVKGNKRNPRVGSKRHG